MTDGWFSGGGGGRDTDKLRWRDYPYQNADHGEGKGGGHQVGAVLMPLRDRVRTVRRQSWQKALSDSLA